MPKSVLHKEIVTALRDCHEHIPFLVLLSKHDNLNIFAGVRILVLFYVAVTAVLQ